MARPVRKPRSPSGPSGPVKAGRITRARKATPVSPIKIQAAETVVDLDSAPPVDGEPPAWAETRPELCDALPWFRSVQGGVYHNGGFCWGFLVDADCGIRSYIGDEVIITRVGGGCTKDADGNLVLLRDQDESCFITSIINSKEHNVPVGIIIGNRNVLLGRKLPHRYNVMAYFRVTDIWFERIGGKAGGKVRFEKIDLENKSWWAEKDSPPPSPIEKRGPNPKPEKLQCPECSQLSTRIYNEGWTCLQPSCKSFWAMEDSAPPAGLTFHPDFLNYRAAPDPSLQPHYSLVPNLLSTIHEHEVGTSLSRIAWRGIVCPQCSKCISRRFWRGWRCTDDVTTGPDCNACSFERTMNIQPVSLRSVIDDFELSPIKRTLFFDPKFTIPEIDDSSLHPYRKLIYRIPGVGSLTHFASNKAINSRENGPNDLFRQLQISDLGLRRYPLQQSVVPGTLTAHFAVNFGMPYKYVVSVGSKGFSEAPDEILRALGRLSWATEKSVVDAGDPFLPPNELLMLGYFEDMKIGYHDDGESSLGPTIATLSLGAAATMYIRMKYKYYHGFSKARKLLDDDPVLQGCRFESERRTLKEQFKTGEITKDAYDALRREVLFKHGRNGEASPIIKMVLNHGDLVVMHGEKLQKYYEHSVVPDKKLRFALTARYIKPDHVDERELKKGEFMLSPDQIYDGK
ncbi:hypothetical protein SI65_09025 [Aspergillus cristatus]|uniref:Fe2OG dioxygenase domain-containing protein n=1 Tax=Aspergillus cristatus TaxID=573508 RepID=A0A1E3B394_ASPCR|nr:hypothetical protein SI65_09025 [Aspergillus cristatus]